MFNYYSNLKREEGEKIRLENLEKELKLKEKRQSNYIYLIHYRGKERFDSKLRKQN